MHALLVSIQIILSTEALRSGATRLATSERFVMTLDVFPTVAADLV